MFKYYGDVDSIRVEKCGLIQEKIKKTSSQSLGRRFSVVNPYSEAHISYTTLHDTRAPHRGTS